MNSWSGMADITRVLFSTEPALAANYSSNGAGVVIANPTAYIKKLNRLSSHHGTPSLSTERQVRHRAPLYLPGDTRMETHQMAGTTGCPSAHALKYFSQTISHWRSRPGLIRWAPSSGQHPPVRRLAAQDHGSPPNRSRQKVLQPARYCVPSLPTGTGPKDLKDM